MITQFGNYVKLSLVLYLGTSLVPKVRQISTFSKVHLNAPSKSLFMYVKFDTDSRQKQLTP